MRNKITSGIRQFRKPLSIFNFAVGRNVKIVFCVMFLSVFAIGHNQAGTWRDGFDGNELNGWERVVEDTPWFAEWSLTKGALFGEIVDRPQEQLTTSDFLHWNAHQFHLDRLTVVGEEIGYPRHDILVFGQFCLFLGKRHPEPGFAEGYIFSPEETAKMKFSVKGDFKRGNSKAKYELMWRLTREHLKVVFDAGRFRLFTQDILVTEFFDAEITGIDVVGLLIMCELGEDCWFHGNISTFSVSGRGIPNHNFLDIQLQKTHLATSWGALKRF